MTGMFPMRGLSVWRRRRRRAALGVAACLLLLGVGPPSAAFAQLPDFLKPKNIPLPERSPRPSPGEAGAPRTPDGRGSVPRIAFVQAAKFLEPGEIWDVFLVLEDEGGDLKSLEWELRQKGPGGTSRGTIPLVLPRAKPKIGQEKFKEDEIDRLAGFVELDTGGPDVLRHPGRFDGLRMTLTLWVVDRNSLQSAKRSLPLTLRLGAPRPVRPVLSGTSFRNRIGRLRAVFPDPLGGK
ncbi:MAG: hypothetical protein ACE5IM_02750 [Nitrospinota bacterium]